MQAFAFTYGRAARFFVLLLLMLMVGVASAIPPSFVFRGTAQPPDDAFANGFTAGDNDNLIQHLSGTSCVGDDSAFVPTSSAESVSHDFALGRLRAEPGSETYVYRIRAAYNFYSAVESLRAAYRNTGDNSYNELANDVENEHEWMAHGGIQASQVESVMIFRRNAQTGRAEYVETRYNSRYVSMPTNANPDPYTITSAVPSRRSVVVSALLGQISACFSCLHSKTDSKKKRSISARNYQQCNAYQTDIDGKQVTVIDPITDQRVQRVVPWRTRNSSKGNAVITAPMDCNINPSGSGGDRLSINCPGLAKYANRFSVQLGAGGPKHIWVDKRFDHGAIKQPWSVSASDLPVKGTSYSLADYSYPTGVAFSSYHTSWWSNITMMPVYPPLPLPTGSICGFKEAGYVDQLGCVPEGGVWPRLDSTSNDAIESIGALDGQRYKVCKHFDFGGGCAILTGRTDATELKRVGLNKQISSIRACLKPTPNVWEAAPRNHGLIGDIYVDDKARSGTREFYRLKTSTYEAFPVNPASNDDWEYLSQYDEC